MTGRYHRTATRGSGEHVRPVVSRGPSRPAEPSGQDSRAERGPGVRTEPERPQGTRRFFGFRGSVARHPGPIGNRETGFLVIAQSARMQGENAVLNAVFTRDKFQPWRCITLFFNRFPERPGDVIDGACILIGPGNDTDRDGEGICRLCIADAVAVDRRIDRLKFPTWNTGGSQLLVRLAVDLRPSWPEQTDGRGRGFCSICGNGGTPPTI